MTRFSTIFAAAALLAIFATACDREEESPAAAPSEVITAPTAPPASTRPPAGPLALVDDRSLVCMVNDQFMGRPQIPVTVNGNTYYGCCEMCEGRLANDPASRTAVDPVSHRSVDKATAVIGQDENGTAVYFESEENLVAFSEQARSTRP
jgi:YHS domain-containing protein